MSSREPEYIISDDDEDANSDELTFSIGDSASNANEIQSEQYFVNDAKNIIYTHDDISLENALLFNQTLKKNLRELKLKLERMLNMCRQKYKANEKIIADLSGHTTLHQTHTVNSFYFCGYPFFKDRNAFKAPPTADYLERRNKRSEMFPLDLEDQRVFWVARDKVQLIHGVKNKLITYLHVKGKDKIRKVTTKRRADEALARITRENADLDKLHLSELFNKIVDNDFTIDWFTVAMVDLNGRHTPNECEGMWTGYLMPSLLRTSWTTAEEDQLLSIATVHGAQDWLKISKEIDGRSPYQCFVHYQTVLADKNQVKNSRWSKDEDEILIELVDKFRIGSLIPWTKILEKMPGRYKSQIYNRYMFSLNPKLNRTPFSIEEDCILMAAVKEYGQNFNDFPPNLLPARSLVQIRNRYNNVLKFVGKRDHWTLDHDIKLLELVSEYGQSNWVKIAETLGNHNRISCRSRYTTITKFLKKNPKGTIEDVPRRKRPFSTNVTTDNWMETIIKEKHPDYFSNNSEDDEMKRNDSKNKNLSALTATQLGTKYYSYFRYSFNFQYGDQIIAKTNFFENLQMAYQLLHASGTPSSFNYNNRIDSDYVTLVTEFNSKLETGLLNTLSQMAKNQFFFPVNLNTILGLRGLVIMFECHEILLRNDVFPIPMIASNLSRKKKTNPFKTSLDKKKNTKCIKNNIIHRPLDLFKVRFFSLFKQTAVLAKLSNILAPVENVRVKTRSSKPERPKLAATKPSNTITSIIGNECVPHKSVLICVDGQPENVTRLMDCDIPNADNIEVKGHMSTEPSQSQESVTVVLEGDYDYTLETDCGVFQIKLSNIANQTTDINIQGTEEENEDGSAEIYFIRNEEELVENISSKRKYLTNE